MRRDVRLALMAFLCVLAVLFACAAYGYLSGAWEAWG
jgi:hypothetical protein